MTLRKLTENETPQVGDYWKDGQGRFWPLVKWKTTDGIGTTDRTLSVEHDGPFYRQADAIPEGWEACSLAEATKVFIGETWCESNGTHVTIRDNLFHVTRLNGVGLLCIRKKPEPVKEPLSGVVRVDEALGSHSIARLPAEVHGKTLKWEVVE